MSGETGGDGLPFIGSLMSLVSHGEIRYEGTLFTIDMPNSTIALSNVRCFGTEGRRKDNEVPPSDQVFEYVVFKGSEIKELTVVQPPPPAAPAPPPPPMGFSDPAIASVGPPPPPPPGAPGPWGPPPPPGQYGGPPPPGGAPFGSSPWGPPPPAGPPPPPAGMPGQPAPAPAPTVAITAVNANGGAPPAQQQRPGSYAHAAGGRAPMQQRGGRGGRGAGGPGANQHQHQHQQHGGRGGRGGQQQQQQQQQIPCAPPVEVPKEEFNFEEALKKFNKVALEKEAEQEHVPVAPAQSTYVKDDFFDQLSCDTLERIHVHDEGGREDWRSKMAQQRKVDIETFGGLGRAGGRGYRGRGRGGYHRYGGNRQGRGGGGGGRGRGGQQQGAPADA